MTNIFLTTAAADAAVTVGTGTKKMAAFSAGSSSTGMIKKTQNPKVSPLQITDSAVTTVDGTVVSWYTPPLLAVTITGTVTCSMWTREGASTSNAAPVIQIERCDGAGNIISTIIANSVNEGAGEAGTTAGGSADVITLSAANITDTTLSAGDRLRITAWMADASAQGGSGTLSTTTTHYMEIWVNGATGGAGQSQLAFTETITAQQFLQGAADLGTTADMVVGGLVTELPVVAMDTTAELVAGGAVLGPAGDPFQFAEYAQATTDTSRTVPVIEATSAGDTLLITIAVNNTTCTISGVADTKGNVYTLDKSYTSAQPMAYFFRSPGATGGPAGAPTVALTTSDTLEVTTANTSGAVSVHGTAAPGAGALDNVSNVATGSSTTPSVSGTPTNDGQIAVAGFVTAVAGNAPTFNSPFIGLGYSTGSSVPYASAEYRNMGAGTGGNSQTATETITSANWRGVFWNFLAGIQTLQGAATPGITAELAAGGTVTKTGAADLGITAGLAIGAGGANYRSTVLADSPSVYYRLGDSSAPAVPDAGAGGGNANMTGTVTFGQNGALTGDSDKAVSFPGTGTDYLQTASSPGSAYDLGDGPFSIEFWYKSNTGALGNPISKGSGAYLIRMDASGHWILRKTAATNVFTTTATFTDTTQWHHVVMTRAAATQPHIYVDGVDQAGSYNAATFVDTTNGFAIGVDTNVKLTGPFNGLIDEVAIYKSVLSQEQVTAHYNAGTTGGGAGITITTYPAISPNVTAGLVAGGAVERAGAADLNVTAGLVAAGARVQDGAAALGITASMVAAAKATQLPVTALGIATGLVAGALDTKLPSTNLNVTADLVAAAKATQLPVVSLNVTAGLVPGALVTKLPAAALNVTTSLVAGVGGITNYRGAVLADSPSVYYRLGEACSPVAPDAGAGGVNATSSGTVTFNVDGAIAGDINKAVSFPGVIGSYLTTGNTPGSAYDLGNGPFSIEFWYKVNSIGSVQIAINKGVGAYVARLSSGGNWELSLSGTGAAFHTTNVFDDTSSWHHIVLTRDTGQAHIYIDGVDQDGTYTERTFTNTTAQFVIGGASTSSPFDGSIDEVAIYKSVLSQAQVTAHYNIARITVTTYPSVSLDVTAGLIAGGLVTELTAADLEISAELVAGAEVFRTGAVEFEIITDLQATAGAPLFGVADMGISVSLVAAGTRYVPIQAAATLGITAGIVAGASVAIFPAASPNVTTGLVAGAFRVQFARADLAISVSLVSGATDIKLPSLAIGISVGLVAGAKLTRFGATEINITTGLIAFVAIQVSAEFTITASLVAGALVRELPVAAMGISVAMAAAAEYLRMGAVGLNIITGLTAVPSATEILGAVVFDIVAELFARAVAGGPLPHLVYAIVEVTSILRANAAVEFGAEITTDPISATVELAQFGASITTDEIGAEVEL